MSIPSTPARYKLWNSYLRAVMECDMKAVSKGNKSKVEVLETCLQQMKACFLDAWRKFVEENQRLAAECAHLVSQCNKLENECSLYDHDREALMDFWNEVDQRAKEAEFRVEELEDELGELREELKFYKNEYERLSGFNLQISDT